MKSQKSQPKAGPPRAENFKSQMFFLPRGQGILEVVFGLSILLIGLFGTLALALGGLKASKESTHRLQAINLAREGLEVVRNIRDSNWLKAGVPWDAGLSAGADTTAAVVFQPETNAFSLDFAANAITDAKTEILLDPTSLPFRRLVTITARDASTKHVLIHMEWDGQGKKQSLEIEDVLTNWK